MKTSDSQDRLFADAVARGALILDPVPRFFQVGDTCQLQLSGDLLYADNNHLSRQGALFLQPMLEPIFSEVTDDPTRQQDKSSVELPANTSGK
jgi:hypothetical protein